ncbi:hypothetical protein AWM68_15380 [Fictibacillus phosphorivorans]|uniref:Uncharacterized protein n=1 Tax=Fictibacillus phosphorivorans TaxID=1221500 RepID=A0A165MU84_9BACL|nr:hypothetical protein AWM68_15380 [Fictibacillus phosphorivorans]
MNLLALALVQVQVQDMNPVIKSMNLHQVINIMNLLLVLVLAQARTTAVFMTRGNKQSNVFYLSTLDQECSFFDIH